MLRACAVAAALLPLLAGCVQPPQPEASCRWAATAHDEAFHDALAALHKPAAGDRHAQAPPAPGTPVPIGWMGLKAANATSATWLGESVAVTLQAEPPAASLAARDGQAPDPAWLSALLEEAVGAAANATAAELVSGLAPSAALHPFAGGYAAASTSTAALPASPDLWTWIRTAQRLAPIGTGAVEAFGPALEGWLSVPTARLEGPRAGIASDAAGTITAAAVTPFRSGDGFEVELNTMLARHGLHAPRGGWQLECAVSA